METPQETPKESKYPVAKEVIIREIEEEMKQAYLDYAMSVIVARALPDVRDGLKPVHRRILYAMYQMGMFHNKPYKKSARIVGEVLGKYHPHGDSAVYDALVRMAQEFSLRYPLIDGQGNFGSIDGDSAAAMRYTEARMARIAEEMLADIEKETVPFADNFDGSLQEPVVLPTKLPNLLINGVAGIAVGMATNIPPHNLTATCRAIIKQIENPEISVQELIETIEGPDFPTGGIILGKQGIYQAYTTGKGKIKVRAKIHHEGNKLIVTEIPYAVNKATLIQEIAQKVKDKVIEGIADIRDESDRHGIRIVIVLKRDTNPEYVENQLFKYTNLQTTYGIQLLALLDNQPKILTLKELISHFIEHRKTVIIKRTAYDLKRAEERKHILEGLIIALDHIDVVIQQIKQANDVQEAQQILIKNYELTEVQAKAILEMRLQKLANLEQEKIRKEHAELLEKITYYQSLLQDVQKIYALIKQEMEELIAQYGDDRKTLIEDSEEEDILLEDLIKEEEVVVTLTHRGYVKRTSLAEYRAQGRGGKGITAAKTADEDAVKDVYVCNTHHYILIFTNKGKVYWLKVYALPQGGRTAKGKPIVNLLPLEQDELVNALIPVARFDPEKYVVMITKQGIIKKTSLEAFSRPRKSGIIATVLDPDDALVTVVLTNGQRELVIATKNGLAARIHESSIRSMGRVARGVRGIRLTDHDEVIGMIKALPNTKVLTISERGYGKKTPLEEYRLINRGGKGVINFHVNEKTGKVISLHPVIDHEELLLISQQGISIRIPTEQISVIGRNTQGVRLMKLQEDDKVVSSALILPEQQDNLQDIKTISEALQEK